MDGSLTPQPVREKPAQEEPDKGNPPPADGPARFLAGASGKMVELPEAVSDIYLSDQWRIHGGPGERSAREELRDRLIPLVIKAFGSVESSLDVLLKESPCSTGNRIKTFIRACQLFSLRMAREAVEAEDQAREQRFANFAIEFGKLDKAENLTTAAAAKVRAILRTGVCRLPVGDKPATPIQWLASWRQQQQDIAVQKAWDQLARQPGWAQAQIHLVQADEDRVQSIASRSANPWQVGLSYYTAVAGAWLGLVTDSQCA